MARDFRRLVSSQVLRSSYTKTLVLGMIVLSSVLGFLLGSRATLRTEYPFLAVATPSMTPTLPVGTLIVVRGVQNGSEINTAYGNGDIIVFHRPTYPNDLIVHRAVEKTFKDDVWYIRTKGDYNPAPDRWRGPKTYGGFISEELVVGKVVGWVPWVGNISLFLRRPEGMFVIVLLFLAMIFIEFIPLPEKKKTH